MSNCRNRKGQFTSCKTGAAARGRRGVTPTLIETADEMEGIPGPIMYEETGEENVYFLDGYGQRYYFKMDGVTFSEQRKIRQYFTACIPSR